MKIVSIFNSIDGEVNKFHQGRFSTFIRLAGCNLFCDYCDTKWSWDNKGIEMSVAEIVDHVENSWGGCGKITITGGEPLLQKEELYFLCLALKKKEYNISIEANGTLPIPSEWPELDWLVDSWIVDYKSSSVGHNFERRCKFAKLRESDWVKFVVGDREEYNEIFPVLRTSLAWDAFIAVSPMHGQLDPAELITWLQKDNLFHCVINLQLHKYIWPNIKQEEER
ncbi:MAG: radical SAM protein [Sulfuricurvum sp.]|nr:radical SAM protein [Sulfuricurvum sp.]